MAGRERCGGEAGWRSEREAEHEAVQVAGSKSRLYRYETQNGWQWYVRCQCAVPEKPRIRGRVAGVKQWYRSSHLSHPIYVYGSLHGMKVAGESRQVQCSVYVVERVWCARQLMGGREARLHLPRDASSH